MPDIEDVRRGSAPDVGPTTSGSRPPQRVRTRAGAGWLVRSGAGLIVLAAAAAAPVAAWVTAAQPPVHEVVAVIAPRPPSAADDPVSLYQLNADGAQRFLQGQEVLLTSPGVIDVAAQQLGVPAEELSDYVGITTTDEGSALRVTGQGRTPEAAAAVCTAVLEQYQRVRWGVARDEARQQLAVVDREIARQRLLGPAAASAVDALVATRARLAVRADAPLSLTADVLSGPGPARDVSPSPLLRALAAAAVAAATAATVLVVVRLRRTRAVRVEDLPLPDDVARLGTLRMLSDREQLYRATTAMLALPQHAPKTVLVLGSSPDALETEIAPLLVETLRDLGRQASLRRWDEPTSQGSEVDVVDGGWAMTLGRGELPWVAQADVVCVVTAVGADNHEVLEAASVVSQVSSARVGVLLVATR